MVVAVVASIVSTFLTWGVSGARGRSSYELVRSAERLLLLDDGAPRAVGTAWLALPLIGAIVVALLLVGWNRGARVVALLQGVALSGAAGAIIWSPGPVREGWGARLGLIGGLLLAILALVGPRFGSNVATKRVTLE